MSKEEILAQISKIENELSVLKALVNTEEEVVSNPVVEELPAPPAEIHVDIEVLKKTEEPDPEAVLGCQIITELPDFYQGTCSVLRLHKLYFDNGQPKLYINKYKVVVIALDNKMHEIGRIVTHWNNLAKFHAELSKRGINTHTGENWMPKIINLDLD